LCDKLGNVIFFCIRHGIFDRGNSGVRKNGFPTWFFPLEFGYFQFSIIISKLKSGIKIVLFSVLLRKNFVYKKKIVKVFRVFARVNLQKFFKMSALVNHLILKNMQNRPNNLKVTTHWILNNIFRVSLISIKKKKT
jgi:hypothetical protein